MGTFPGDAEHYIFSVIQIARAFLVVFVQTCICKGIRVTNVQSSSTSTGGNQARDQQTRAPTILDVAKLAGVGKSSVSRVLNSPQNSKSPYASRILAAAEQLGYRRDIFASGLRRGKTDTIGVVVPRLTDPAMALFYEAVSRQCMKAGKIALVATSGDDLAETNAEQAARTLIDRQVDGIILTTDRAGDPTAGHLRDLGIPHVCALRSEGDSPSVLADDIGGSYHATSHLLQLGHRKIAIVNGPSFTSNSRGRLEGFFAAHRTADLEPHPDLMMNTDFTVSSAVKCTHELLDRGIDFTACVAATDNLAIGVTSALKDRGITVPAGISVTGFNDIPIAKYLPTRLTTVSVPYDKLAAKAVETLLDPEMTGQHIIPTSLIIRDSTQAPTTNLEISA